MIVISVELNLQYFNKALYKLSSIIPFYVQSNCCDDEYPPLPVIPHVDEWLTIYSVVPHVYIYMASPSSQSYHMYIYIYMASPSSQSYHM